MLKLSLVPSASCNYLQNLYVNLVPLFDVMDTRTPCFLTISFMYSSTSLSILEVIFIVKKRVDLVSLSTITILYHFPYESLVSL